MVRTIIHGARIGEEVSKWGSAYRYQISILLQRGEGKVDGLLVLLPRCEIFLVRALHMYLFDKHLIYIY